MAGHSKWANIKHRKARQDSKRAKVWTKIIKELTVAAKEGDPDPEVNPRLRLAVQNAKGANMPKDTIERAIKKGSGADGATYEEVSFEGYAAHGIAVFVECTTDNNNRTVSNVRAIFNKHNGALGTNGSLEFLFDRKGVFTISSIDLKMEADELELELIDGGAEEVEHEDGLIMIYTSFDNFGTMQAKLEELNIEIINAEVQRIPNSTSALAIEPAQAVLKMIDAFEEDEDVQNIYHNLELTEELLAIL